MLAFPRRWKIGELENDPVTLDGEEASGASETGAKVRGGGERRLSGGWREGAWLYNWP